MKLGMMDFAPPKCNALGASQTISSLTELSPLSQNDVFPITDTANGTTKKVKWGTATSSMKTIFDIVYSPIFSTSAGLAGLLSDETGSSGGFVRAGTPTISTPNITTPTFDVTGTDATGDTYYNGGSGVFTRLAIGTQGKYLMASSTGLPEWDNTYILTNPQVASSTFTATTTFTGNMIGTKIMASSTAGSTITGNTLPQPVSLSTSTNRINPADANDYMYFDNFYGFAVQSGASGASILVQTDGVVSGFSGLTAGATYYVQDAVGTIGTSVGTYEMKVGVAISTTEIKIERGDGEYLGSVGYTGSFANTTSCQMTATSTYMANKFISDLDGAGAGGGAPVTYNVTLPSARRGATTVNSSATLGSPSTNGSYTVALSGNVITATAGYSNGGSSGSCSGTLYMYR